tara:strand:- start:9800 stop:11059 length:1260 start_codon:yes stop_codon:yes gene_type:complete
MKNKQICLFSLLSSGLLLQSATSVSASPLVSIGDNAAIFFKGSSSLRWVSNVFRDETDEVEDLVWTVSPGFKLDLGHGASNADFSVTTRYDILRYEDTSRLDVELFHIRADGSYRGSRLSVNGSLSFDESKTSSGENNVINDLISFDTTAAKINSEYQISPKFSFGSGLQYSEQEYTSFEDRFADRETFSVPLDVFYELTPKVDLSLGYSYTHVDIEGTMIENSVLPTQGVVSDGYESTSHFFNVGARGYLLPKLSGSFKIGYRMRSSDDSDRRNVLLATGATVAPAVAPVSRDDTGMLGLDADLTWMVLPKMTAGLALSRDFGVGGEGESTENSSAKLYASYAISSHFSASANLGYTLRDYTDGDREDDQYNAGVRVSYSPNEYWSFSTGYTYTENDSNQIDSSYENNTLDLTATLRY